MTVLNIQSDGYFNVLGVLSGALKEFGPMTRDQLLSLCSAGPASDDARLKQTITRWVQPGHFADNDGKISLGPGSMKFANGELPGRVRRVIFLEKNNKKFWDNEGTLAADLTRGLSFLLAQDIYLTDVSSHSAVERVEQQQISDQNRRILQNDVRWNGLRSWGIYLGFLWQGERLWVDPTRALREDLPLIFGKKETLTASEFMGLTAKLLPVLDGGDYRLEVERNLDSSQWREPGQKRLISTSLSRALWRLLRDGTLAREDRADTGDRWTLLRASGNDWTQFTHLRLAGGGR